MKRMKGPHYTLESLESRVMLSGNTSANVDIITALSEPTFVAYAPTHFNPDTGLQPDNKTITADLKKLRAEGFTGLVTYSLDGVLADIPRIAKSLGFGYVIGGIYWYDGAQLEREFTAAVTQNQFIDAFKLGNEGIQFGRYTVDQLVEQVSRLKEATGKPIMTSEPDGMYKLHPELLNIGDVVFPIIQPYWAGLRTVDSAVKYVQDTFNDFLSKAPGKEIIIAESWWPSAGGKEFNPKNQALFNKQLLSTGIPFVFGEAFNQVWKTGEGSVGPNWGINDSKRSAKAVVNTIKPVVSNYNGIATFSEGRLTINGTNLDDVIETTNKNGVVVAKINHQIFTFNGKLRSVKVNAKEGNDFVDMSTCNVPTTIYGGGGNDTLFGGIKNDYIRGDFGVNKLYGGGGADKLVYGTKDGIVYLQTFNSLEDITKGNGSLANSSYIFEKGILDNAIHLTNNDYISFSNIVPHDMPTGTISFAFNPGKNGIGIADFISGEAGAGRFGFFSHNWGNMIFESNVGGAYQTWSSLVAEPHKWNNLTLSWDNRTGHEKVSMYFNGFKNTNGSTFPHFLGADSTAHLGRNWWYGNSGDISFDNFKIWDRMISDKEAASIYSSFKKGVKQLSN